MIPRFHKTLGILCGGVALAALLSCAPSQHETAYPAPRQAGEKTSAAAYDMAQPRGLNTQTILTEDLQKLVGETQIIQSQINALMGKLEELQFKILSYNAPKPAEDAVAEIAPVSIIPQAQTPVMQTPVPQKKAVIQPVEKAPETPRAPETIAVAKGDGVVAIRLGTHSDKTRLVLDVKGSTHHTQDFDREAGILTITLPETPWSADVSKVYNLAQLSGYEAKPVDGGTVIAMSIKNVSGVKTSTIGGSVTRPARLIIDLLK